MATTSIAGNLPQQSNMSRLVQQAWSFNKALTIAVLFNLATIPMLVVLMVVDPVTITGVNGWVKPLKFAISVAVYSATFLWLLTYVRRGKFWIWLVATLTGVLLVGENLLIVLQVIRRTTSHFNNATSFDLAVFNAMGGMIMVVALACIVTGIWLLFERMQDRVLLTGLRWGVWIAVVGMLVTYLMVMPTSAQLAELDRGRQPAALGAHSVGVEDGGPGLPIVGWSTTGGDLRVGHFVGLHAMQVLPLVAWFFNRRRFAARWNAAQRIWLVRVVGATYLALVALVTVQALRGQALIAPDWQTLGALTLILLSATLATLWIVRTDASPARIEAVARI